LPRSGSLWLMLDLSRKRVLVVGAGVTGEAVVQALRGATAELTVADDRPLGEISRIAAELEGLGAPVVPCAGAADEISRFDLVIPSPGVPPTHEVIASAQSFGIPILSEIEIAYRLCRAPILAVTGTNGKSTTVVLAAEMISEDGRQAQIAGNIRAEGLGVPLITAAVSAAPDSIIVAEVSSFQLDWVEEFRPKVGVLTNLGIDHLDRHRTADQYWAAKAKLFRRSTPCDFAVLPLGDPTARERITTDAERVWYSMGPDPRASAWLDGGKLCVGGPGESRPLIDAGSIGLLGKHNIANVLAAAAAVLCLGVSPDAMARAAREFRGLPHRMQPVATVAGVEYINNSMCTNVEAAIASISSLGQPLVVIAGGRNKGFDFGPLARALRERARHVALIGESQGKLAQGLAALGFRDYSLHESLADAVAKARGVARPGDVVILAPACASQDMFSDFEERGREFVRAVRSLSEDAAPVA
jgi:UDP-N-acetylmuramoylalanine--D-glutamate ligase